MFIYGGTSNGGTDFLKYVGFKADFKAGLYQEECARLHLAFGSSRATKFRCSKGFCRSLNSFLDKEHTGKPLSAVILDNVFAIQKMLMDDNRCTYK